MQSWRDIGMRCAVAACALIGHAPIAHAGATSTAPNDDWITPAERADFATTPSYAQTRAYLERLAAAAPRKLSLTRFGVSPEGRDLMLVVAANDAEFTPERARASGKDIVLVQAGIHAGEIEGKDAGLMLLRDLVVGAKYPQLLDHVIIVYLPIFNVDGHEQSSAYNRINQNGPREMGFRATAQYLNLNRDYMKADAPEMRDWLRLFDAWLPDLFIDSHTTDGADYRYDLTWYLEQWGPLDGGIKAWQRDAFERSILPAFEQRGHLAAPYLELVDHRDIRNGIANFGSGPRFSTGYVALENRAALLVETHMLKPYATRVRATYDLLVATLEYLDRHPGQLRDLVDKADAKTIARAVQDPAAKIAVAFKASDRSTPFTLEGYAFTQTPSAVSGDTRVRYDPSHKRRYEVPNHADLVATDAVTAPAAYLIPAAWSAIADKLREHGIRVESIAPPVKVDVERYQLGEPQWFETPFEGRHPLRTFTLASSREHASFGPGSWLVPLDQRTANVAIGLLEPRAADSLLHWGFFDAVFEQKESADTRVAEQLAETMLAENPALKTEFAAKLAADPAFAASPERRLAFFYERSPWFAAQRVGVYPIVRLDVAALRHVRNAR